MPATVHPVLLAPFHMKVQLGVFCAEQDRFVNRNAMHILHHLKFVVPDSFRYKEPVSALSATMAHTLYQIPALVTDVLVDITVSAQKAQFSAPKEHIHQGQFHAA